MGAKDSFNGHHSCSPHIHGQYPIDVDDDVDVMCNLVQVIRFKE